MTDEARARELAKDIVRQWFSRSCGAMDGWKNWKDIWTGQLTEQFAAAFAAVRAGEREACQKELKSLRAFKRSVEEAVNSGDGSYRP